MPGQVAIENVLDAGAVIQEAQQGVPILLGVPYRVPHDDDIEAPLLPREAVPLPFPFRDQRGPIANIEKAADPLFIKREIYVVPLVLPEQVDDRIEGGLVIHKAHLEEEPDFAHPHLSLPSYVPLPVCQRILVGLRRIDIDPVATFRQKHPLECSGFDQVVETLADALLPLADGALHRLEKAFIQPEHPAVDGIEVH